MTEQPIPIRPSASGPRRSLIVAGAVVVGLLLVARSAATFWTDYLWFDSVSLTSVWTTLFVTRIQLVVAASIVAFILLWATLALADRLSPRSGFFPGGPDDELLQRFQDWIDGKELRVRTAVSAFFGIMIGLGAAMWWEHFLLFRNGGSWGVDDPVFDRDIGLYIFDLPFFRDLFGWAFQLVLVMALLTAALHYLNGAIQFQGGDNLLKASRVTSGVKVHLSVLLAILAALKAVGYQLDKWELLYSPRGQVVGASYTDVNAQLPALNLLILISLAAAVILLVNLWFRGWTLPLVAAGLWLFTSIAVGGLYPAFIQQFRVAPQELERESEFVAKNIEFTRQAYGLDNVQVRDFAASPDLDAQDIADNRPTIDNIRLWDPAVLEVTYKQLQELRQYYRIADVDVDRYTIDDEIVQVMVSTRELDEANIPTDWVNSHLVYTHGFGSIVSPAAAVTPEGQPDFFVKDIPPVASVDALRIDEPRIYFGADANDRFVIANTEEAELDFPLGSGVDAVSTNQYDGSGGVNAGGVLRRLAFALRFGDVNTLISGQVQPNSKVIFYRNVVDRIRNVAPFLETDADPYMVVVDGRLVWVVDMYTLSNRYPYSALADRSRLGEDTTLLGNFNYIRNSVKAVVDAYDGSMDLYVVDDEDPLIRAWDKTFPDLFEPGDAMSPELVDNLRYPEELFRIQSDMYRAYHVSDPRTFFNTSDLWQIAIDPSSDFGGTRLLGNFSDFDPMLPYYLLMKLPGEDDLSFLIMQPFVPLERPNMISFLVAKSGPDNYGEMIEFAMPRDRQINGPGQVGALIDQNPDISPVFSLLDQQGSEVVKGSMLVVPVEESVMYVQPIYISAKANSADQGVDATAIPEFKFVVVAFEDEIVMRESLDLALQDVFGGDVGGGVTPPDSGGPTVEIPDEVADLIAAADMALQEADAALRDGDLVGYATKVEEAARLIADAQAALSALSSG